MTAKYYVDAAGKYAGAFDGVSPPNGSIEVPEPPLDASQAWDGERWMAAPSEAPRVVSKAQGIRALYDLGALDQVEALVDAADRPTQLAWATVSEFHRDSPMIAAIGADLDLDSLFTYAATVKL